MDTFKSLIRIVIITAFILWFKSFVVVQAYPVRHDSTASERMLKPPQFPYGPLPPGYTSSALLCPWFAPPYFGGWFGRSCAGPIPPFKLPTRPTTTEAPPAGFEMDYDSDNPYADYGNPVDGNPWEPDDEDVFLETYGMSASKQEFQLGDPSHRKH